MVADSCVPSGTPEAWVCPPCGVTVQFYLRFSVFTFILIFGSGASDVVPLLPTLFSGVCATSPYLGLVYGAAYLVSPAFEPLSQAYFRTLPLTTLFLLALATAKMGWGSYRLNLPWSPLWLGMIAFLTSRRLVTKSESLTPFLPSLLLGDVLSRLCGWS